MIAARNLQYAYERLAWSFIDRLFFRHTRVFDASCLYVGEDEEVTDEFYFNTLDTILSIDGTRVFKGREMIKV